MFDARWAAAFADAVRTEVAPLLGKPWFVGWFVDNEMGWGRPRLLDAPPDAAVRRAWLDVARGASSSCVPPSCPHDSEMRTQ